MDAFYASVEQRDNPQLKGKPIAVGGNKERGVVAAASYEARTFGVKSAMPSTIAARKCPELIFVKPRFARYQEVSRQIHEVFREYTDMIEPLSLDEAYLDVTTTKIGKPSATLIAQEIRTKIFERTQLTASAGISYCKFLAKTASDVNKPNGLFVILPEEANEYLRKMPIHQFHGIGKATAEKMKLAGIFRGEDLRKKSLADLTLRFGKSGAYYYYISRGIDNRPVISHRERKSISAERTFDHNIMQLREVHSELTKIAATTFERYIKTNSKGYTVTIKIKYGDFKQITKSHSLDLPIDSSSLLEKVALDLATKDTIREEGIRLLGVGISNFKEDQPTQLHQQLTIQF